MIPISCVVTAPKGIGDCLLGDYLLTEADGVSCEIVVADGSPSFADRSRPGLRHISVPGASLYGLMVAGLKHAINDWVIVLEDHGRPMPGLLETYRAAIADCPDIDLFGGALENATSVAPWSFATFLYGSHEYWPSAGRTPIAPTNANLMIRRSAIREAELTPASGFMFGAVRRLVREGRYRYCPDAVVDHVVELTFTRALATQFHCTARVTKGQREALPAQGAVGQLARDACEIGVRALAVPAQKMAHLRGTSQFRLATAWRLVILGLSCAGGILSVDAARLRARPGNPPQI
jgi:hypothetical protein